MKKISLLFGFVLLITGLAGCKGDPSIKGSQADTDSVSAVSPSPTVLPLPEPTGTPTPLPEPTATTLPSPTPTLELSFGRENYNQFVQVKTFGRDLEEITKLDSTELRLDALAYSQDGRFVALAVCTYNGTGSCTNDVQPGRSYLLLLDAGSGEILADLSEKKVNYAGLAFSPQGDKLYVSQKPAKIFIIDLASESVEKIIYQDKNVHDYPDLALSPDGSQLAAVFDHYVWVWDTSDWELIAKKPADNLGHRLPRFSADGSRLLVFIDLAGGELGIYETTGWEKVGKIANTGGELRTAAISPDGKQVAVNYIGDSQINLWDVDSQEMLGELIGELSYVDDLAYSPNGNLLLAVGGSYTYSNYDNFEIWDAGSQQRVGAIFSPDFWYQMWFSPDGSSFITTSSIGVYLSRWSLPDENILKAREALQAYFQALNTGDLAAAAGMMKPDPWMEEYFSTRGIDYQDLEAVLDYMCGLEGEPCSLSVEEMVFQGMDYGGIYNIMARFAYPDGTLFTNSAGNDVFWMYFEIQSDGTVLVTSLPPFP